MPDKQNEIAIVTAESIQGKIYVIRGVQVMLDFELAELYGYTTTRFNEQVRNNIVKFDDDFRFQLTREEWNDLKSRFAVSNVADGDGSGNLMSKKSTSSWGGRRKLPYAFTEQGIYMLMTVLRGELATQQNKALIRLFKQMKEFIATSQELPAWQAVNLLSLQTAENTTAIKELQAGLAETQETLTEFMAGFAEGAPFGRECLIMDGMALEADVAYRQIYGLAERSVYVVDNYIGVKTLLHLRHVKPGVDVTVFSDNIGKGLAKAEFADFCDEYPGVVVAFKKTGGAFHDRFIVIDHGADGERVFACGSSSKDAGRRTTVIMESTLPELYRDMVDGLLDNPELLLK